MASSQIVDFSSWESSKENIQPLKKGRDAKTLSVLGENNQKALSEKLEQEKREWETVVNNYKGEDPLKPWLKYINWAQQSFPSGGKSELLDILERCTRQFKDIPKYKNSEQYIRVWADACTEPLDIFNFMQRNEIGQYIALFYEAWAVVLERNKNYPETEKVYQTGIQMLAQPIDRLKKHYNEFQARMARRIYKLKLEEEQKEKEDVVNDENNENQRAPLQKLTSKQASSSIRNGAPSTGLPSAKPTTSKALPTKKNSQTSLQIFVDDEFASKQDLDTRKKDPATSASAASQATGSWKNLPTEKEKQKENTQEATTWNKPLTNKKLPTATRSSATSAPSSASSGGFTIFEDTDFQQERSADSTQDENAAPVLSIREQLEPSLKTNPLKNFTETTPAIKPSKIPVLANSKLPLSNKTAPPKEAPAAEKMKCDMSLLVVDGVEYSFEEIRATKKPYFEEDFIEPVKKQERKPLASVPLKPASINVELSPVNNFKMNNNTTSPTFNTMTAMTVNTKQVMEEVMAMFRAPLQTPDRGGNSFSDDFEDDAQEVTVTTVIPYMQAAPSSTSAFAIFDEGLDAPPAKKPSLRNENTITSTPKGFKHILQQEVDEDDTMDPSAFSSVQQNFAIYQDSGLASPPKSNVFKTPSSTSQRPKSSLKSSGKLNSTMSNETFELSPLHVTSSTSSSFSYSPIATPKTSDLRMHSTSMKIKQNLSFPSPLGVVLSPSTTSKSRSVITDNSKYQMDPFDQMYISAALTKIEPPLSKYKGYYNLVNQKAPSTVALTSAMQQQKSGNKRKSLNNERLLELERYTLEVDKCVGSGGFASVFLVHNIDTWDLSTPNFALKVQSPPCSWEFYICNQIQQRIPDFMKKKYCKPHSQHVYQDTSFLLMDYSDQGTLQDVINAFRVKGNKMDETLIMYYAIEMLTIAEAMHNAGIIHGDIKPDNFLIFGTEDEDDEWGNWQTGGWPNRGLKLIDYGRSIDLKIYPEGTIFKGDSHTDSFRCIEMQLGKPWTYQIDIFGICAVVHCLLYGNYMEVTQDPKSKRWRPKEAIKRYWQVDLWQQFFDACLNIPDCDSIPSLSSLRKPFENFLTSDMSKAKQIKSHLCRQQLMMYEYDKSSTL